MLVICEIGDLTAGALWSSDAFLTEQEPAEPASLHQWNISSLLCILTATTCNLHSDSLAGVQNGTYLIYRLDLFCGVRFQESDLKKTTHVFSLKREQFSV